MTLVPCSWWVCSYGRNSLHAACAEGRSRTIELLLSKGAFIDSRDKQGNTCLHKAAMHGQEEVARLLVNQHATVSVPNTVGQTPLMLAVKHKHIQVVKIIRSTPSRKEESSSQSSNPSMAASASVSQIELDVSTPTKFGLHTNPPLELDRSIRPMPMPRNSNQHQHQHLDVNHGRVPSRGKERTPRKDSSSSSVGSLSSFGPGTPTKGLKLQSGGGKGLVVGGASGDLDLGRFSEAASASS